MVAFLKYIIDKMWSSYYIYANEQYSIGVDILTALLTGGFLMLFIENRHIGDDVESRYHFIMKSFMHRLCNYFKFISTVQTYYVINNGDKEEYVHLFKSLLYEIEKFGNECIMSGQDYPCSKFNARELNDLCDNINRIWYYWDDKHSYMEGHYTYETCKAEQIGSIGHEYLKEVFPNEFEGRKFSMPLISDVSGKFYCDIWSPIKHIPFQYENWQKVDRKFKNISLITIWASLTTLVLILLLRYLIPIWIPILLIIICMIGLGYALYEMIKLNDLYRKIFW